MSLITGGAGYIGTNLAKKVYNPIIYDLKTNHDILDYNLLEFYIRKVDVVYHLAAITGVQQCQENLEEAIRTNLIGTYNVMSLAHKYNIPAIFASSFAVYQTEKSIYGISKSCGEEITSLYGGRIVRIANVYGGLKFLELKDTVVARLMKGTFKDVGHGKEKRDFVHVDDVVLKLMQAQHSPEGTILEACTGRTISIDELVELSKYPEFPDNLRR